MSCFSTICAFFLTLLLLLMWAILIYVCMLSTKGVVIINVSYFPQQQT